jgi:hypothetical protein
MDIQRNTWDRPPRCLRCGEVLNYLPDIGECGQCGLQYDYNNPATFTLKPPFLLWKFWFPGFLAALISGIVSYAVCLQAGELGYALFVAVPVSVGAILGYATRTRYWLLALLGIAVTGSLVLALVSLNLAGFFCGMTLSLIFLAPLMLGMGIGAALRYILKATRWSQRWFLPLIAFVALPYVAQLVELAIPNRREVATIRTQLHIHATPAEAWDAVMFFEEVEQPAPWLLEFSLPKPLGSSGRKDRVGELVRCQYDRGWIVKRISRIEPGKLLEFDVVQQRLKMEHNVTLRDGSFRIERLADGTSRVVLTTRYERHLAPGWVWRPIEKEVVHTMHRHILEGMAEQVEQEHAAHKAPEEYRPMPSEHDDDMG